MNDKTIQELREWGDKRPGTGEGYSAFLEWGTEFQEILSRAEQEAKEEPLAVLADRKGFHVVQFFKLSDGTWSVHVDGYKTMFKEFFGPTYAAAESKARAYLAGLPDKEAA